RRSPRACGAARERAHSRAPPVALPPAGASRSHAPAGRPPGSRGRDRRRRRLPRRPGAEARRSTAAAGARAGQGVGARRDRRLSRMDEAPRTLDELLREAGARIERFSPVAALDATAAGALIVDIRSEVARKRDGVVPGAIHVPRTVLEWRFEPGGQWRNPYAGGLERRLIVLC